MASKVELNSLTLASGPRGSSASSSHSISEFGCASSTPGRKRLNRSAARFGSESTSTAIGQPRSSDMASAVISRECTKETWMATVSRRRNSGVTTEICGR
jgi:hypothetical protein